MQKCRYLSEELYDTVLYSSEQLLLSTPPGT